MNSPYQMSMNSSSSLQLPSISRVFEGVRLGYGSFMRICLFSAVYYGSRGYLAEKVFDIKDGVVKQQRDGLRYVMSMTAELGVSVLIIPARYLAAINTPRFMFDYLSNSYSDILSLVDGFSAGKYASFATYAFLSDFSDWNFDFFMWQVPAALLTLGKLLVRRHRHGSEKCRTKRILGVLLLQVLTRASLSSFSISLPENTGELLNALVNMAIEVACTSYLARHTWPVLDNDELDGDALPDSTAPITEFQK